VELALHYTYAGALTPTQRRNSAPYGIIIPFYPYHWQGYICYTFFHLGARVSFRIRQDRFSRHRVEVYPARCFIFPPILKKGEKEMESKRYLTPEEISEYLGISLLCAYKIFHDLNEEIARSGRAPDSCKVKKEDLDSYVFSCRTS